MSAYRQYERDEDDLLRRLRDGEISKAEYNDEMRDLQRCYREAAQEAAEEAYGRELENW